VSTEEYAVSGRFDDAYPTLFVRALRSARAVLRDEAAAEDVAAETLARALVRWSTIGPYASAWVTRVSLNLALDVVRRKPRGLPTPEPGSEPLIDHLWLQTELAKLPRQQRVALVLRYILDLDESSTAAVLGVSVGTVHTHLRRGLSRLRTEVAAELQTDRGAS